MSTVTNSIKSGINKLNSKKVVIGIFIAVLVIQVLSLVYLGYIKDGFHIDENYSYILSNSHDYDKISSNSNLYDNWISGEELYDFVKVSPENAFSYDRTYINNTTDAHPPLYYFFLHTVCSVFSNTFTKWTGIGLNIAFFIGLQILLFFISTKLLGMNLWAVVPMTVYGGTLAAIDTAMFIRMYTLLTLLTVAEIIIHYYLFKNGFKFKYIIWTFALTFLGTFTQYFFAVFAFFIAAIFCVRFLVKKEFKSLLFYGISMLLAVGLVFVLYPAAITQITGSQTNNIGNEVAGHFLDFSHFFASVYDMCSQFIKDIFIGLWNKKLYALIVLAVFVVLAFVFRKPKYESDEENREFLSNYPFIILLAGAGVLAFLATTHISGKFVYLRYVYNIIPVFVICAVWLIAFVLKKVPFNPTVLAIGLICLGLISSGSVMLSGNSFVYSNVKKYNSDFASKYAGIPTVVVEKSKFACVPTQHLELFGSIDKLYISGDENISEIVTSLKQVDTSKGIVFLVITDNKWCDGLDGEKVMTEIISNSDLSEYRSESTTTFSTVYFAK